jgi:hypothetical protein
MDLFAYRGLWAWLNEPFTADRSVLEPDVCAHVSFLSVLRARVPQPTPLAGEPDAG